MTPFLINGVALVGENGSPKTTIQPPEKKKLRMRAKEKGLGEKPELMVNEDGENATERIKYKKNSYIKNCVNKNEHYT